MIIARPEIAIMIVCGIMLPTGDNYSDMWLSYKFFTGNYEPAGKFYVDDSVRVFPYVGGGRIGVETQPNYGMMTLLPLLVSFLFTSIHWHRTEGSTWNRLKTFPLLMCQIWPQFRVARILYLYRKNDDRWIEEKQHHEKELSSLDQFWNGTSIANNAWCLKPEGDMFFVENDLNEVLEFSNNSLKKEPFLKNNPKQLWKKEKVGDDGLFTLRSPPDQNYLTLSNQFCNSPIEDFCVDGLKFIDGRLFPSHKSYSMQAVVDDVYEIGNGGGSCKKENCGLVSMKGKFLGTFILSVLSAAFGVGKFLKNGPMTLVPKERYGPSFVLGTFFVALNLVYKGIMLGNSFKSLGDDMIKGVLVWSSTFLLPQFIYAMVLALTAFGFRKSLMLFFRFPGTILLPMFTPFTFGPVIGSCSPCCGCCRTSSNCDRKLAKSPMELSFTFTYVNVVISAIGGAIFLFVLEDPAFSILIIVLPLLVAQFIFIGIFHLFEKKCLCCCNFCFPFTKRETFDIGDAPAWQDAMTDLSHVYQDAPDPRVEVEAVELENLGQVVIKEPIPEATNHSVIEPESTDL